MKHHSQSVSAEAAADICVMGQKEGSCLVEAISLYAHGADQCAQNCCCIALTQWQQVMQLTRDEIALALSGLRAASTGPSTPPVLFSHVLSSLLPGPVDHYAVNSDNAQPCSPWVCRMILPDTGLWCSMQYTYHYTVATTSQRAVSLWRDSLLGSQPQVALHTAGCLSAVLCWPFCHALCWPPPS